LISELISTIKDMRFMIETHNYRQIEEWEVWTKQGEILAAIETECKPDVCGTGAQ
jgi:hypothetical protein